MRAPRGGHYRIGFDFDDVLVSSADHTVKLYNELYGTKLTRDDWYDDPSIVAPWEVASFADIVTRVVEIQAGDAFDGVEPLKDAREVLRRLKRAGHELVVITGRPPQLRANTERLLKRYYGDIFTSADLYLTDHFAHEGERVDKGDIALQLKLTHFVDDVISHANSVARKGIKTILFSDNYKWNQAAPDKEVVRLSSWQVIGDYFHVGRETA